jgi:hypothetical protein
MPNEGTTLIAKVVQAMVDVIADPRSGVSSQTLAVAVSALSDIIADPKSKVPIATIAAVIQAMADAVASDPQSSADQAEAASALSIKLADRVTNVKGRLN